MEQHMEALQRANIVRFARTELKRAVKSGEVMLGEVLLGEVPDWLEGMRLEELCNAIPRFTWRHFQRLMQLNHARLAATVGDFTARKRCEIGEDLGEWESAAAISGKNRRARERQAVRINSRVRRYRSAA